MKKLIVSMISGILMISCVTGCSSVKTAEGEQIAEQYSIYAEFGMSYNQQQGRFFFDEKTVRYFNDSLENGTSNSFSYKTGAIDVIPKRDSTGKLSGLRQATNEQFDERTAKQAALDLQFQTASTMDVSDEGCFELGDPDAADDTLLDYKELGLTYDDANKQWLYNKYPIYAFYDKDGATYINYGAKDGVNLKVVRNQQGGIEKLAEMTDAEVEKIIEK